MEKENLQSQEDVLNNEVKTEIKTDESIMNEETDVEVEEKDNQDSKTSNEESDKEDNDKEDEELKLKKKSKKDKKDEKIEELNDRLVRSMAEFDNYRKRTEKEKTMMFEIGAKSIVEKILPVIDNLERGFLAISEEERQTPFAQGIDKIYKQFLSSLEEAGVKPIEAVGQEFNTDYHNAVMHVEDDSLGENVVAEEFQKGYMYKDSVVRHSMVKVAN